MLGRAAAISLRVNQDLFPRGAEEVEVRLPRLCCWTLVLCHRQGVWIQVGP